MTSPIRPYLAEHENPQGEGDARPTAMKIILDDDLVNKLTGKVFLVTGTSSGIGVETVRALHATGADVFMHVRDMVKGESARKTSWLVLRERGSLSCYTWIWVRSNPLEPVQLNFSRRVTSLMCL